MGNILSNILYRLGDAAACGDTPKEKYDLIIDQEFEKLRQLNTIQSDLQTMKEVIGYLGSRISSLEDKQPQQQCKVIKMQ